jgi:hypothetical protein
MIVYWWATPVDNPLQKIVYKEFTVYYYDKITNVDCINYYPGYEYKIGKTSYFHFPWCSAVPQYASNKFGIGYKPKLHSLNIDDKDYYVNGE